MGRHQARIKRLERRNGCDSITKSRQEIPDDPIAFAQLLGITPDPWQRDLLTSTEKYVILNCSRQSGKSTTVAILALYQALTAPKSLILILSPSQRQSAELLKKIADFHRGLGRPGSDGRDSATSMRLSNGSRIVALPGSESTTRGYSGPALILVDEAAQVDDDLYRAARPMLAVSNGRLILLSTPRGKRGIFWSAWDHEPDWHRVKVTADQCPRIDPEFLERERHAIGEAWYAQEYCCAFVQSSDVIFKESWVRNYAPNELPEMDTIIQSWDTAATKSATSDYVVGQVWGRKGADFFLLDQVRGRFDFDETVEAIRQLSAKWPDATAKLIEAQMLGPALATHLKHEIPGLIPISVKGSKEQRALNSVPLWLSGNVYVPRPDNAAFAWVRDYLNELLGFPGSEHDDQVDATTLALNQLRRPLFADVRGCVAAVKNSVNYDHYYMIGWVPARGDEESTILVYNRDTNTVVLFERAASSDQTQRIITVSSAYNDAVVRAFDGADEAIIAALETRGVYMDRISLSPNELVTAYEHLALLIQKRMVTFPDVHELIAELDVFTSGSTFDGSPDYTLQTAQQSGILSLCLVTHDVSTEKPDPFRNAWLSYDLDAYDH